MALTIEHMHDRAVNTHACMVVMQPTWEWDEQSPADFKDALDAAVLLLETDSKEGTEASFARGELNKQLTTMRGPMRKAVLLARRRFRDDASKLALLKKVKTHSNSRVGTLQQALLWEKTWAELDPAWTPEPGATLAAFGLLRAACKSAVETAGTEVTQDAKAGGDVIAAFRALYNTCVAWYAEAAIRFGQETPHGVMIRAQIPRRTSHKPGRASLTVAWDAGAHQFVLGLEASHATSFNVRRKGALEKEFKIIAQRVKSNTYADTTAASGVNVYQVEPINSRGRGPLSEEMAAVKP